LLKIKDIATPKRRPLGGVLVCVVLIKLWLVVAWLIYPSSPFGQTNFEQKGGVGVIDLTSLCGINCIKRLVLCRLLLTLMVCLAAFAVTGAGCGSEVNGQRICYACQAKGTPPYKVSEVSTNSEFKGE